ncbi:MAG: hypothetical protein NVSMB24_20910 [Mucilaginibacter sp.]
MRNDKLIPGLVLVLIGAAFLLNNFGYIHFHWINILHLWPLFLVMAGINLVFAHNRTAWATILKISVLIGGFAIILFGNFGNRFGFWPHYRYTYNNDDNGDNNDDSADSDTTSTPAKWGGKANFSEPYKPGIKYGRLNISGGGTSYRLNDVSTDLFEADTHGSRNKYDLTDRQDDSTSVLDFHMHNHNGFNWGSEKNDVNIRLNPNPIWDVNVETGATDLNFDLSKFKVKALKLHGGAASFNVKMGAPLSMTDIEISTGVSSVEVSIPQNAACSIQTDSGLSSNNFDGFNKASDNNFETPGYSAAKNKMYIHISGGLSDFKVKRY